MDVTQNAIEIAQHSLTLLDDIAHTDVQSRLERFATLETWIDSSIAKLKAEQVMASPPASTSVAVQEQGTEHIVYSSTLSQKSSRQKLQNENLIKALQELRARMNDSKLRSGKVISTQN